MPDIVGIRFREVGKIYYFSPNGCDFAVGEHAIVETVRGIEYGDVVIPVKNVPDSEIVGQLKPVIRKATVEDGNIYQQNLAKKPEAMELAKQKIAKHKLEMKLVDVEYTFDNTKVIFYFTAEGRVDFRELVKDLASVFRIRIELRQIGIRDECKLIGGLGPCGQECCCNKCLGDFERVSIKMAKTQGLSLNPTKISGLCGRLMCCLKFENDHYSETIKFMPAVGSEVKTPDGVATVESVDMLRLKVRARITLPNGDKDVKDFDVKEIISSKVLADSADDVVIDEEIKSIID